MRERKKKIIKALSLLLVVLFITVGYALITTDRVNVKGTNNKISIYVQDGSSYTLATFNTIPKRGYKLNTTRTVCDDVNTVVTWDNSTRTISLTTNKNPKCSVYLDDLAEASITTYTSPTGKDNVQDAIDELFEKIDEYIPRIIYAEIVSGASLDTVGTEIALGSGANQQNFYVISSDANTVTALAKYNLVRTSSTSISADALQATSATDYNYVRFDDNSSTYAGSEMETYMNNYATKLNTIYSIPSNALITARAITVEELRNFGCPSGEGICSFGAKTWLSGSYWSGSAFDGGIVWGVFDSGLFYSGLFYSNFDTDSKYGARAVITISKSLF